MHKLFLSKHLHVGRFLAKPEVINSQENIAMKSTLQQTTSLFIPHTAFVHNGSDLLGLLFVINYSNGQ